MNSIQKELKMKITKSQLKSIIREVIEESKNNNIIKVDGKYNVQVIDKSMWPDGKTDPTEYSDDTGVIKIRSDYDYKKDPAGWFEHEKGHADWKGSRDVNDYPDNPIEWQAFGRQFKYLQDKGYDFDDIFKIKTMEHEVIFKDFFRKVWDKVKK